MQIPPRNLRGRQTSLASLFHSKHFLRRPGPQLPTPQTVPHSSFDHTATIYLCVASALELPGPLSVMSRHHNDRGHAGRAHRHHRNQAASVSTHRSRLSSDSASTLKDPIEIDQPTFNTGRPSQDTLVDRPSEYHSVPPPSRSQPPGSPWYTDEITRAGELTREGVIADTRHFRDPALGGWRQASPLGPGNMPNSDTHMVYIRVDTYNPGYPRLRTVRLFRVVLPYSTESALPDGFVTGGVRARALSQYEVYYDPSDARFPYKAGRQQSISQRLWNRIR